MHCFSTTFNYFMHHIFVKSHNIWTKLSFINWYQNKVGNLLILFNVLWHDWFNSYSSTYQKFCQISQWIQLQLHYRKTFHILWLKKSYKTIFFGTPVVLVTVKLRKKLSIRIYFGKHSVFISKHRNIFGKNVVLRFFLLIISH